MRTGRWLLTLGLIVGCGSRGEGDGGGATRATSPVAKDFRCFDLPGTQREDLQLLPDGKRLAWTERRIENSASVYDFVALDIATGATQVLQKDARFAEQVGDRIAYLRPTPRPGAKIYELKNRLYIGDQAITPESLDQEVSTFRVDRKTGTVFYTLYRWDAAAPKGKQASYQVWKVPVAGGAPEKIYDDASVHHVIDGGLIVSVTGDKPGFARAVPGSPPQLFLEARTWANAVVGDKLVYLTRTTDKDTPPALQVASIADGAPVPLPGARPSSRLITGGDQVFVIDRTEGDANRIISRTDGTTPIAPIAHLFGIDVISAVMLADKVTLAVLLVHDTNDDGKHDYKDEVDVCLVPTSSSPKSFTPPTRTVPKRLAPGWKDIEALAAGDLAGAKVRYLEDDGKTAIQIEAEGEGAATLDELFARIKAVAATSSAATKDPALGVVVSWKKNNRLAAMLWDDERKLAIPRAGAWGMVVHERASFDLAANPRVVEKRDYSQRLPTQVTCSGTVTNLGSAPIDVEVECRAWSYDKRMPDEGPSHTKRVTVAAVAPGATAKYSIDFDRMNLGIEKSSQHFFVGGKEVPWFNEYAWNEASDYIATNDRIRAAIGYAPDKLNVVGGSLALNAKHYSPEIVAPDFNAQSPERQAEIAKIVWTEFLKHYKATHGGERMYDVRLHEGSVLGRSVRNGKLEPNPDYNKPRP